MERIKIKDNDESKDGKNKDEGQKLKVKSNYLSKDQAVILYSFNLILVETKIDA